jgi:ribose-phosphate pyrophosphokinase
VPGEVIIIVGTANPDRAAAIAVDLRMFTGGCAIERFPDGETAVQPLESVRHKEVVLVQPLSPPLTNHLVELLVSGKRMSNREAL